MDIDILIVGGGLAGLALVVALRDSHYTIAVIEGRTPSVPPALDTRIYALTPGNARFLTEIGIWRHLDDTRLQTVEEMTIVGDKGGELGFSAYDTGVDELAWIVESAQLQHELWESTKRQGNVQMLCPAKAAEFSTSETNSVVILEDGRSIKARLVVGADGADSWTRKAAGIGADAHDYAQQAVVANFTCAKPHRATAFQWFREDGILAWLPLPDARISMVWSTTPAHAQHLLSLSANELCAVVAAAGEEKLGALDLITPAATFPLRLQRASNTIAPRLALIGDAAHTIHPLSGHGINLGFHDARELAKVLNNLPDFMDCGAYATLRRFERARKEDVLAMQATTHALHTLFATKSAPLGFLRNIGMNIINRLPLVREALVRYALN